jgi:hypothetical protein
MFRGVLIMAGIWFVAALVALAILAPTLID